MGRNAKIAVGAVAILAIVMATALLLGSVIESIDQREVEAARAQFSNGITIGLPGSEAQRLLAEWGFASSHVAADEFDKYSDLSWNARPAEGSKSAIVAIRILPKRIPFPVAETNLVGTIFLGADGSVVSSEISVSYTGL